MATKDEILPLTGLRFVAAMYVFLFHIEIRWPFSPSGVVGKVLAQGAVGMSIFFILSGFLLAYQYSGKYEYKTDYFVRRIARIYPVYLVAALSTLPWIYGLRTGSQVMSGFDTFLLVMANIFAIQAWVPAYFKLWNDSGSWSISVEMFCYAVLPFIAPWMGRMSNRKLSIFASVLYLWSVAPGQLYRLWPDVSFPFIYALPIFRLPEFLLGVCAFLATQRGFKVSRPYWVLLFVLLAFVVYVNLISGVMTYVWHNWVVVPMILIVVLALRQSSEGIFALLSTKVMVWLGKVSYSFYSFQALLLFTLITFHDDLVGLIPLLKINWVLCLVSFLVLVILSALGYHLIEEPCRRKIQKWVSARGTKDSAKIGAYTN